MFFKERHAFDAAHYLFEIITRKGFYIAHGRLIGFVSQVLPLIGIYANLSLKSLMLLYSFGDVLYYYLIFLIAAYIIKSEPATISILLIVFLAVKFSFYCPVTELLQGMALLPLLYEALLRFDRFKFHLIPILLILIIFSHPLLFILAGFVVIYFISQQKVKWLSKQNLFLIVLLVLITASKLLLLDTYDYQKTFYPVVFDDYSNVDNLTDIDFIFSFLQVYFKENFLVGIFWVIALFTLISNKRFRQLAIAFFLPVLYLLLIIITHHFTAITNYSERMLLPFAGMVILTFAISIAEIKSSAIKHVISFTLLVSIAYRLWIIYDASFPYTKRVAQIEELINQCHQRNISKCIIDERNLEYLPYAMTGWSYPIESMLLSSIHSKDSAVTIALKEEHYNRFGKKELPPNEIYKTQDSIINYSVLNNNYFSFPVSKYVFLNSDCNEELKNNSVEIIFSNQKKLTSNDDYCYLPIQIFNRGNSVCSRIDNGYQIQMDAVSETDSAYRDNSIIPFQADIDKQLNQDLVFKNYGMNGKWKITAWLIDKNKQQCGKSFTTEIEVE